MNKIQEYFQFAPFNKQRLS